MRTGDLVLFACAGLLLSGGGILGGSTAWSLLRLSYYFWTSDLGVELATTITIIAGSLLCLPACWIATLVPYHVKSASLATTLMSLVIAAMLLLAVGLSSLGQLARELRDPAPFNASMLHAMSLESCDPSVKSAFAAMQLELKCCGVKSYNDWYQHRDTLPPSCCGRIWNGKRGDKCDVPTYPNGCLRPAIFELKSFTNSLSALASCAVFALAVTLFAAAYTLVTDIVERSERNAAKAQMLRIACIGSNALPMPVMPVSPSAGNPAMQGI